MQNQIYWNGQNLGISRQNLGIRMKQYFQALFSLLLHVKVEEELPHCYLTDAFSYGEMSYEGG